MHKYGIKIYKLCFTGGYMYLWHESHESMLYVGKEQDRKNVTLRIVKI